MLDQWEQISLDGVGWSEPQVMPDLLQQEIDDYFHGDGIPVERVILDIHNGHILGKLGTWLLDVIAIIFIFMSLSGLVLWGRRL